VEITEAEWDEILKGQDKHVWELYHALNMILPGGRWDSKYKRLRPLKKPSKSGIEEAQKIFKRHSDCCGKVYDAVFIHIANKVMTEKYGKIQP
jgi:hypothetical protein